MPKLIGLSVSKCIEDIVLGRVELRDVEKIISRTAFNNEKELEYVLIEYSGDNRWLSFGYWKDRPGRRVSEALHKKRIRRAKRIARELYAQGRIEQPRLTRRQLPNICTTHHWIGTEASIEYIDDPHPLPEPDNFNEWLGFETLETIKKLSYDEVENRFWTWHESRF
jgi:hypothetical protein